MADIMPDLVRIIDNKKTEKNVIAEEKEVCFCK